MCGACGNYWKQRRLNRPAMSEHDQLKHAVGIARAALRGEASILEAAMRLNSALIDSSLAHTGPAIFFNGVSSETDHLPIGSARQFWELSALSMKDTEAAMYEAKIRDQFMDACREIIIQIGESEPGTQI